jgi:hypothetical protein
VRILSETGVFIQASVVLTDNRKDTSLPQNLSVDYESVMFYSAGANVEKLLPLFFEFFVISWSVSLWPWLAFPT